MSKVRALSGIELTYPGGIRFLLVVKYVTGQTERLRGVSLIRAGTTARARVPSLVRAGTTEKAKERLLIRVGTTARKNLDPRT